MKQEQERQQRPSKPSGESTGSIRQPVRYAPASRKIGPRRDGITDGEKHRRRLKLAEGGAISPHEAARLVGSTSGEVLSRWADGRLVAWQEGNTLWFPIWQFRDKEVLAGVEEVLRVYRSGDEWQVMRFFLKHLHDFDNRCPLDLIRSGETERVVQYVATYPKIMRGKLLPVSEYAIRADDEMLRVPDFAAMRPWRGKRAIVRAMILLAFWIQGFKAGRGIIPWLDHPNPLLDGDSPADVIMRGQWRIFADMLDEMLTGDRI